MTRDGSRAELFANKTRVLLVLPQDVLDRARVMAGKATTALKLPVSVQIVLRALIMDGLRRDGDRTLLLNIEEQAQAVRRIRSLASHGRGASEQQRDLSPGASRRPAARERQQRNR